MLHATGDGNFILDVLGSFDDSCFPYHLYQCEIILGQSENGTNITLYECFELNRRISSAGFQSSVIQPNGIFVGGHFESSSQLTFFTLSTHYSHIDEWANISGFKIDFDWQSHTASITYRMPDSVEVSIDGVGAVFIDCRPTLPALCIVQKEAAIAQRTYIRVRPREPLHIKSYFSVFWRRIEEFLTLAIGDAIYPLEMRGKSDHITELHDNDVFHPEIDIYYRPPMAPESQEPIPPYKMLFTYKEIADKFPEYLATWMSKAEVLEPVFNLYFGTLYNRRMYLEQCFLSIIHAIEAFHARTFGDVWMSEDQYKPIYETLVASIPDTVSRDHQQSLDSRLKYGNEFSLRKRLKEILNKWKGVLQDYISNEAEFIGCVVDTRNYLTHHDESLRPNIAHGQDLLLLTEKLQLVVIACLLGTIGFLPDTIETIFKRHAKFETLKIRA